MKRLLDLHGLGEDIDSQLSLHLISLYFAWQNPAIHVVDRQIFELARAEAKQEGKMSIYYSDLLVNAMSVGTQVFVYTMLKLFDRCAVGALQCGSRHPEHPGNLPHFFARRARALLDYELDCPKVSTVQALAILSVYESATASDTLGWLFSGTNAVDLLCVMGAKNPSVGMTMRLALDLGLHVSAKPYVQSGSMSQVEARVRRVTFWGTYAIDR